jgi:hypothetical protein
MDTIAATRGYEAWLGGLVPLCQRDLDYKHRQMADRAGPFPFFRGTYYLWVLRWAESAGDLAEAPAVLAIGDLHLENFGTWRDGDGRLCWGVNDFDEVDRLPYTNDLVRLAASVRLAWGPSAAAVIKTGEACRSILAGYRGALEAGGKPFVLEENNPRLRGLAMQADRDPVHFWKKLTALLGDPEVDPPADARKALASELPDGVRPQFRFRPRSGMGSLGKPRFVALAQWSGSWMAREAKALTPAATAWAARRQGGESLAAEAARRAVRCPDPYYRPEGGWVLRRLGPRCSRIELDHLRHARDPSRLLRAMGAETANVHLGTDGAAAAVLADLRRRPDGWLAEAARSMARTVVEDWRTWRSARR